ncbi:hypothetical protein ONZ45_g5017 [Pleurotus djamor]|nr:hypothetical protein ONZ45_g5017 [Pleurotus djamor]
MANLVSRNIYTFFNAKSNTVADLSGGDNTSVIGFQSHGGANQKWMAQQDGDGWTFCNLASGKYLGVERPPNGYKDDLRVKGLDQPFRWKVEAGHRPNTARVLIPGTPFSLDMTNYGSAEAGTPIAVWGKWEADNQLWYINSGKHFSNQSTILSHGLY